MAAFASAASVAAMFGRRRLAAMATLALTLAPTATAAPTGNSLKFFEGRTYSDGTLKIMASKPHRVRSVGQGSIGPDGSLSLVQQVQEQGKPLRERRWHIRRIGPNRFAGTMSEAAGEVRIDEVSGRYRFRFKMKGGLNVEQWLIPQPGGEIVRSELTVRKLGLVVATGKGTITRQP